MGGWVGRVGGGSLFGRWVVGLVWCVCSSLSPYPHFLPSFHTVPTKTKQQHNQVIHNLAICMARVSAHAPSDKDRDAFTQCLVGNMRSSHDLTRCSLWL